MKHQRYRHVTRHNGKFTFQLAFLGQPLRPNEHWDNEEDAACAADLTKHYFRENFFLDQPASLDPELFVVLSHRLNVDLSDSLAVCKSLPRGVIDFLMNHRHALDLHAENNRPETKPWEALRKHPQFYSNGALHDWVLACELAEVDKLAFESLNGEYFLTLVQGFVVKLEASLSPLRRALKMHSGAPEGSARFDARKQALAALIEHLETDLAYVRTLPELFRKEEDAVMLALQTLESNRPTLT